MAHPVDRTGRRYGRLVIERRDLSPGPGQKDQAVWWICRCDCGNVTSVRSALLARGGTRSCGCLHREELVARLATHGMTGTSTYRSWMAAKRTSKVEMCRRWRDSFEAFLADMGERPPGRKLGRLDLSRGFEPANCAWLDEWRLKAARPSTPLFEWRGEQRSLPQIAEMEGVPVTSLKRQIWTGLPVEEAVERARARMQQRRRKGP